MKAAFRKWWRKFVRAAWCCGPTPVEVVYCPSLAFGKAHACECLWCRDYLAGAKR